MWHANGRTDRTGAELRAAQSNADFDLDFVLMSGHFQTWATETHAYRVPTGTGKSGAPSLWLKLRCTCLHARALLTGARKQHCAREWAENCLAAESRRFAPQQRPLGRLDTETWHGRNVACCSASHRVAYKQSLVAGRQRTVHADTYRDRRPPQRNTKETRFA